MEATRIRVLEGTPQQPQAAGNEAGAGALLSLVMDELAHGVVVLALDGRLLHANQAARHELARRRVQLGTARLIACLGAADARVLQDALAKVGQGKRSLVTLVFGDGPPLTVAVLPLRTGGDIEAGHAALMFARPAVCESLMLCFFARAHGLTQTEEQVLGILSQGYSAPQIAQQLGVAVSTVRSHIRSLCAKTRCSGVRELVKRVAVLPPVSPAPWREPLH
jgi:DNA-binding CsgD family transcriptional regulator